MPTMTVCCLRGVFALSPAADLDFTGAPLRISWVNFD